MNKQPLNPNFNALYVIIAGLIVLSIWQLPKLAAPHSVHDAQKRFDMEDRSRQTLTGIFGGMFFLFTAVFTYRTVKATEKNVLIAQENFRLLEKNSEDNRRLELHKIAFSEKFRVAEQIAASSKKISMKIERFVFNYELAPNKEHENLQNDLQKFHEYIDIHLWLFGSDVISAAFNLYKLYETTVIDFCKANANQDDCNKISLAGLNMKHEKHQEFQRLNPELRLALSEAMRIEMQVQAFRSANE